MMKLAGRAALLALLMLLTGTAHAATAPQPRIAAPPAWVVPVESLVAVPDDDVHPTGGEYFLLVDEQINALGRREWFNHYAIALTTQQAVQNNSQISITFDPDYQQLTLHSVRLWRDGEAIDQLSATRVQMLQRESQLDELIFDGRWTALLILEDVRRGDILEYSYSVEGGNPSYGGHFSKTLRLEWGVPVYHTHFRLLWPSQQPLMQTPFNTTIQIEPIDRGDHEEYRLQQRETPAQRIESEAPSWYAPWATITFSNFSSWQQVVDWALPLYRQQGAVAPAVQAIAETIRASHDSSASQVAAALHYVQGEIRYLALTMGVGSHVPADPALTLRRRYGDCKAKSVLLLALLDALGVEAYAALVHTDHGRQLDRSAPRIAAFDHVIVQAMVDGRTYWLDPTYDDQKGALDRLSQPDYGHALVVRPGTRALARMAVPERLSRVLVEEVVDLREGIGADKSAGFQVRTTYTGTEAERLRRNFATSGIASVQNDYLNYYLRQYPGIEVEKMMRVEDDHAENRVVVEEHYRIPNAWTDDSEGGRWRLDFNSDAINSLVEKPDERRRQAPFAVNVPGDVSQIITAYLPEAWSIKPEETRIETEHFVFEQKVRYHADEFKLVLHYQFRYLVDSIPGEEIEAYLASVDRVWEELGYRIHYRYRDAEGGAEGGSGPDVGTMALVLLGLLVLAMGGYALVEFIRERKRGQGLAGRYYPVSTLKFFVLSLLTLNLYQFYWYYKNWTYVKRRDDSTIIPWGRALFYSFWYFPLLRSLEREPGATPFPARVKWGFALLAILYLAASLLSGMTHLYAYGAILLVAALMLPLVEQVNRVGKGDEEAYHFNSRWRVRHALVGLLFGSLLLYSLAEEVHLIPGRSVIEGEALWSRDRQFLFRAGITDVNERIIAFYSDGKMSFAEDGNGVTERGVFSYWKDDSGQLQVERAAYEEIKGFEPAFGKGGELSVIKVIRQDDSHFILFVPSLQGADRRFVEEMERQWSERIE